ncbi:MAG: FAD-dependent oxidoreductase [Verrucomicrobiota bacterium]
MKPMEPEVIIVGGGVSGLACAITLKEAGIPPLVLEASSRIGGRIVTDTQQGYRVDRGFQILLTAYPEVKRFLDLDSLELRYFRKGAHIWNGKFWQSFFDPRSAPFSAIPSFLKQSVFTLKDCFLLLKLWRSLRGHRDLTSLMGAENRRTAQALAEMGFSESAITVFFEPFLGGVFLDPKLLTSEKMFRFVMSMFIQGRAALPRGGMKHISEQLAIKLGLEHIRCESEVIACDPEQATATIAKSYSIRSKAIVLAVDAFSAHRLVPNKIPAVSFNHTRSLVFGVRSVYVQGLLDNTLKLVADPESPIQVIAVPSKVNLGYAPAEHEQIVVTLKDGINSEATHASILDALESVFGKSVQHWHLIKDYKIPRALPRQLPADLKEIPHYRKIGARGWACGDYLETRSLNGALASGRLLAERIIKELGH